MESYEYYLRLYVETGSGLESAIQVFWHPLPIDREPTCFQEIINQMSKEYYTATSAVPFFGSTPKDGRHQRKVPKNDVENAKRLYGADWRAMMGLPPDTQVS